MSWGGGVRGSGVAVYGWGRGGGVLVLEVGVTICRVSSYNIMSNRQKRVLQLV